MSVFHDIKAIGIAKLRVRGSQISRFHDVVAPCANSSRGKARREETEWGSCRTIGPKHVNLMNERQLIL